MIDFQCDRYFLGKDDGSRHHALIQLTTGDLLFQEQIRIQNNLHIKFRIWELKKKINKTSLGSVTGKGEWFYFFPVPSLCLYSYLLSSQDFFIDNTHHLSNNIFSSVFSQHCSYNIFLNCFSPQKKKSQVTQQEEMQPANASWVRKMGGGTGQKHPTPQMSITPTARLEAVVENR